MCVSCMFYGDLELEGAKKPSARDLLIIFFVRVGLQETNIFFRKIGKVKSNEICYTWRSLLVRKKN